MNNSDNFKIASETLTAFLSEFPKDEYTNLVLNQIFSMMLENNYVRLSELDVKKLVKDKNNIKEL
jgi:hypothetical protein